MTVTQTGTWSCRAPSASAHACAWSIRAPRGASMACGHGRLCVMHCSASRACRPGRAPCAHAWPRPCSPAASRPRIRHSMRARHAQIPSAAQPGPLAPGESSGQWAVRSQRRLSRAHATARTRLSLPVLRAATRRQRHSRLRTTYRCSRIHLVAEERRKVRAASSAASARAPGPGAAAAPLIRKLSMIWPNAHRPPEAVMCRAETAIDSRRPTESDGVRALMFHPPDWRPALHTATAFPHPTLQSVIAPSIPKA